MTDRIIDVRVDAAEIVDRVDDMLAWLAIASQGAQGYYPRHFRCARPYVALGGDQTGELMPDRVEALEVHDDQSVNVSQAIERRALPLWLAQSTQLQYAHLIEANDNGLFYLVDQNRTPLLGDKIDDCVSRDEHDVECVKGARYALASIGDDPDARWTTQRYGLPQVARVLRIQTMVALLDGRAATSISWCAMWNRRFYDLAKRPLGRVIEGSNDEHSSEIELLANAMVDGLHRKTSWTVELALSAHRTGVGLRTDALGAHELVNMLRGSDTATGRRKSIVHWVREHMRRRNRLDHEATIKVASHLRGVQHLAAGRYHVNIWPSTNDVALAKNGARFAQTA
jgi:hypothetical protein